MALSEHDLAILEHERAWWKYPGAKESSIREKFGLSATRYYMQLNRIIEDPAALEADPLLVRRLIRLRDARRVQRSADRLSLGR